jgi:hypothetical protein
MAASDSGPRVLRASDADRENAIHVLQDGAAEGRLSHDTFLHRITIALRARRAEELSGLLGDLPAAGREPAARGLALLTRAVTWWSDVTGELKNARRAPRVARLVLPRGDQAVLTIGRSPDCDLTLADITVSWRHAELRCVSEGWVLADLSSTNGTRVNGWRVGKGLTVRPGDYVTFGRAAFRAADHA